MMRIVEITHPRLAPLLGLALLLPILLYGSIPPHPRVRQMIIEGRIAEPYYLQHLDELRARGINAPWTAPEVQAQRVMDLSGITRSLGPAAVPMGSYNALVLLVDFSDNIQQVEAGFFDSLIFDNIPGTMRDYFQQVSYGNLDVVTVHLPSGSGWTRAPQTYAYYVNAQNGFGTYPQNAQKLVEDVVAAVDGVVDFSQYDNDLDGYVDALFVVHAGSGAEFTGSDYDIWSHAWETLSPQLVDGVYVWRYSMEPEYWEGPGDMTIGVYAHEFGHSGFGLPDLYDCDYSSAGLGRWSIMAGGSWNGFSGTGGDSPALPDAWSRYQMGYVTPTNITVDVAGQAIANVETSPEAYRLWSNGAAGDHYFLVENRQQLGYDAALPGSGLLIYHIDESVGTQNDNEWYPGYTTYGHYLVALEQADGLWELEQGIDQGDGGDPYPGTTNNLTFDGYSTPNSQDYSAMLTSVAVHNISGSASIMTADFNVNPPVIGVTPDSLWADLLTGATDSQTLTIANTGTGTLTWSISTEASAAAAAPEPALYPSSYYDDIPKAVPDSRIGQPVERGSGGPDNTGYSWVDSDEPGGPVFDWVDISGTGTFVSGLSDDNYVGPFPIGFTFGYYENNYTEFYIASNGYIGFGPPDNYSTLSNDPIPNASTPNNILAWCWDDLYPYGSVYYQSDGNTLIVQFVNYGEFSGSGEVNAEVILNLDGSITYQYLNFLYGFYVLGSTVGIENHDGTDGLEVAFNTTYLHDNLAVRFSQAAQWLAFNPTSGTVEPGFSSDVVVTFDATGMFGGDYTDDILVSSNDPVNPEERVPATLHVTGAPDIAVSSDTLDYGTVFIGYPDTLTLVVSNAGTDLLTVSSIVSTNPAYTIDLTAFSLSPGESQAVTVIFGPASVGDFPGTLSIASDDPDEPIVAVVLLGQGVTPPVIGVIPDSLHADLFTGDSVVQYLTIDNSAGGSDLFFEISVQSVVYDSAAMTDRHVWRVDVTGDLSLKEEYPNSRRKASRGLAGIKQSGKRLDEDFSPVRVDRPEVSVPAAALSPGSISLLIIYEGCSDIYEIQSLLQEFPDIDVVDGWDVDVVYPTLGDLLIYDAVMVVNNCTYPDPVGLGDLLADYVDAGGGLILTIATFHSGWELQGRLADYMPFEIGTIITSDTLSLAAFDPSHPIMNGVSSAEGYLTNLDIVPSVGAEDVAWWDNDACFIATKGTVVGLDVFVAEPGFWGGEIPLIIHNSALWSMGGATSWLAVDPITGTISAGSSLNISVKFNTAEVDTGDYAADILVASNDPVNPEVRVPATLWVRDEADIPPTVTTLDASAIEMTSATLNATVVNPNREQTVVEFEWGYNTGYGNIVTASQSPVSGAAPVDVSAQLWDLYLDTQYHYRVKAENNIGISYGDDVTFWTLADTEGPAITNVEATPSPSIGNAITITAIITDVSTVQSASLHYIKGDASSYSQVNMLSLGADTHSGTIPGTAVTAAGIAYFITAEDNLGNRDSSNVASVEVAFPSGTFTTRMSASAFPDGFPKNQWRLISIPGDIDNTLVISIIRAELGSNASDETWKIFRYTGPDPDDYVAVTNFTSGESYFLKQVVTEEPLHFTLGDGQSVDLTRQSLTLGSRKWHFVSSPYPFAVSVDADQGTFIGPYTYGAFGSGGQEGWSMGQVQTTFMPWGGYIIYNNTDQTQTLEIKLPSLAKVLLAKGTSDPIGGWLLNLTAEGTRYFDEGNTIGRLQGATEERDEYDHPEPPYLDGYVSLAMDRPDWSPNSGISLFTSDVRTLDETNGLWDLDLRTKGETGPIAITCAIQGEVPPDMQVVLLDLIQRTVYDLTASEPPRAISDYSEQLPYHLKVIAGTPGYVQGAIEEALARLPEEFALSQNYPNPFNPSTTIEYALPKPARVSLHIYSLLGQEIAVLVNDWQDIGYYEIVWQGRDRAGRSVASGIYFARMATPGYSKTVKMLLLK